MFLLLSGMSLAQSKKMYIYLGNEYFKKLDYANAVEQYKLALSDSVAMSTMTYPYETQVTNQKLSTSTVVVDSTMQVTMEQYLHHHVAWCYYRLHDYSNAEKYLKSTVAEKAYPHDSYYLAQSYMNNNKYDEAIAQFEDYIRSPHADIELLHAAQVAMTGCYLAKEEIDKTREISVKMADTAIFNRGTASFATMYFDKDQKLMFTSARAGGVI